MRIPWLEPDDPLPPISSALRRPDGLLAAGGGLSRTRLIDAYRRGCFPWFNEGEPVLWWSPDPRMVLVPDELHVSRSLAKRVRQGGFEIRADTAFAQVIAGCAEPRRGQDGTWISPAIVEAYVALHEEGIAHSIETWIDGALVGGLYGLALGRAFFGESMFAHAPDASKLAFVHAVSQLRRWGVGLVDCQMSTAHLASFGAREMPRAVFLPRIAQLVSRSAPRSPWRLDPDLAQEVLRPRQVTTAGL
jgi:leucyl/phenylalanyl-tRNA---protein transferase